MKLSNALAAVSELRFAVWWGFKPTLLALIHSPSLILHPRTLSRLFFAHVWATATGYADAAGHDVKKALILPHARGVVLDLGAGHGSTALYLAPSQVTQYIAVEPNTLMHPYIRATAARAGLVDKLCVLACGAEDVLALGLRVDTLVTVLTLCSVPRAEHVLARLVREVLLPGGQLLFYEHVASPRADVLWWQRFWTPVWKLCFDGCVLDRPTDRFVRDLVDVWEPYPEEDADERMGIWGKEGEDEENLWWHQVGRLVKRVR